MKWRGELGRSPHAQRKSAGRMLVDRGVGAERCVREVAELGGESRIVRGVLDGVNRLEGRRRRLQRRGQRRARENRRPKESSRCHRGRDQ
jgi:hypothetical protein